MKKTLILIAALLFFIPFQTSADPPTPEQKRITGIERTMQATVKLKPTPTSHGSGFFIAQNAVLTNAHVVTSDNVDDIEVTRSDGQKCRGTVSYKEESLDLAIVETNCTGEPLALADGVRIGSDVYVVGNPSNLDGVVTSGVVSRIMPYKSFDMIASDAAVQTGSSGGPMVNSDGEVVGVIWAVENTLPYLSYAVHLDDVKQFLKRSGVKTDG